MPTLSTNQILDQVQEPIRRRTVGAWDMKAGTVTLALPDDASKTETLTIAALESRIIQAAAIVIAESGGKTDAFCYNVNDAAGRPACSATPPAGPRGIDRGLWQWNSVTWPQITDLQAFNPSSSTDIAYRVSKGYTTFTPWRLSKGMDKAGTAYKTAATAYASTLGTVTPEIIGTPIDTATIGNVFGSIVGWTEALGKLLSTLISPAFWKRVGVGAAGVAVLAAALIYLARNSIISTATLKGATQ